MSESWRVAQGEAARKAEAAGVVHSTPRAGARLRSAAVAGLGSGLALCLTACATGAPRTSPAVDLTEAQRALEQARAEPAVAREGQCLAQAEQAFSRAEALASSTDRRERAESERLAGLALAGARCALENAQQRVESERLLGERAQEIERVKRDLREAQDARRRLEERAAVLTRDLELTEAEVIESKARLRKLETKTEDSASEAEARILIRRVNEDIRRVGEERASSTTLARCHELLKRADQQLRERNYGAAVFFATRAQGLLSPGRRPSRTGGAQDRPPSAKRGRE